MTADVLAALRRLDTLLAGAVAAAEAAYGSQARDDPFRGLHIGFAEVERLLAREPGAPILTAGADSDAAPSGVLAALAAEAELSAFDLDVVALALAPELDLRYERLFAYLQDNVAKKRPTVDLALNLLCASAAERLARRFRFYADAPLLRVGVLRWLPEPADDEVPLLARAFAVDRQVLTRLVGGGLDPRLAGFCTLLSPDVSSLERGWPLATELDSLADMVARAATAGRTLRLYLRGRPGIGRERAVRLAAARAGKRLLSIDARAVSSDLVAIALREAYAHDALCAVRLPPLGSDMPAFASALGAARGVVVLLGGEPWPSAQSTDEPLAVHAISCALPGVAHRRAVWAHELSAAGIRLAEAELDTLADRIRLTPVQIAEVAATVMPMAADGAPEVNDVFASARAQTGRELAGLATRIEPLYGWDDLVVTDDTALTLREICRRVAFRERVLHDWDFAEKLSLGCGVAALFAGPPGTGKTMAAEVVARELRLDLFRIDLAGVLSKWIGETEKNLDRIFTAAQDADAILLFDEADALFGKRGEVQDSHDRYANIEVSYLLQKMETYEGLAILATNRSDDLDEAFLRRLAFVVRFLLPEAAERLRIWGVVWPKAVPLADDIDWDWLATTLPLSGAEIKNIALAAAFLAADDRKPVTTRHLLHAARRELEKAGRSTPWRQWEADE